MLCDDCKKRKTCTELCEAVEKEVDHPGQFYALIEAEGYLKS